MPLDELDLLLLDYVSDLPASLAQLSCEHAGVLFNKPHSGLASEEISKRITALVDAGYVSFSLGNNEPVPLRRDSLSAPELWVSLTEKGGQQWETAFRPDWHRYLRLESAWRGKMEFLSVAGLDLDALKQALVDSGSAGVRISRIKPLGEWSATYWKTFESGYRVLLAAPEGSLNSELFSKLNRPWRRDWSQADQGLGFSLQG
ncbi:MAG TPA: hypothetical protein VJA19_10950 [Pseudomonas sp.]|nr:hypothetical protein [Pseudomonas sp.]